MADERIRRQVAFLAAQMMYQRTETEYFTAKREAARQLGVEYRHRPGDLPSNREIRDQIQADEEFLLAALLNDVGKAIDPADHVTAALQALEDSITERTAWLIAHDIEPQALRAGTLGAKPRSRLEQSEYYEDLMLLTELHRKGRIPGAFVCELDEVLEFLRELSREEQDT